MPSDRKSNEPLELWNWKGVFSWEAMAYQRSRRLVLQWILEGQVSGNEWWRWRKGIDGFMTCGRNIAKR